MTKEELYITYYKWTGILHQLVATHLGEHVDVEYFPDDYVIQVYSGSAEERVMTGWMGTTVPGLSRPRGEQRATIKLPRPEDNPNQEDLEATFRALCLAVARVLNIKLAQLGLPES
jgi:hypothetical protein